MKSLSGKQFCKLVENHGWEFLYINGSHHYYEKLGFTKNGMGYKLSIPVHGNKSLGDLQFRLMKDIGLKAKDL